jgi:membrane protease YdiL (CAAX protease family)
MGGIVALAMLGVASPARGEVESHGVPESPSLLGAVSPENMVVIGFCVAALVILVALWRKNIIRPGSFGEGRGGRDVSGLPAVIWLISACIVFIAPVFAASLAMGLPTTIIDDKDSMRRQAILGIIGYGFAISCAAFLVYLLIPRAPGAGLRFRWKDILIGAGAFVLMLPIVQVAGLASTAVYTMLYGESPDPIAHTTLSKIIEQRSDPWIYGVIACAVFGAPIVEEIVFRVLLQSAFLHVFISRWIAIIGAGILFTMVHLGSVPVHALAPIFVLGVSVGVAYERTARPGVPIVMHALFNLCNVALVLFADLG